MSPGKQFPTFQRTVAIQIGLLDPGEEGTTALINTGNYAPNNTVKHPRKLQTPGKPLWLH
jgi:hypothetical protein